MNLFSDKRGVSEVLGAVLVFALVLMLLVLIQTLAVPAANEQVEFDHNQRIHGDFLDLQQGADVTAARGSSQTANVEAGVRYPNRFFLLNPAPASGSVRTDGSYFRIENAETIDGETAEFWNGGAKNYSSNAVLYRPNYNHYGEAPTTAYEHGLAYNSHPNDETTLIGTGSVVDGNRISLIAVDGNLSTATSSTVPLETEPLSAPMQTVSIRDTSGSGNPITLTLRTGLTNETWEELLEDEMVANGGHVTSWDLADGVITIVLEEDTVYNLRMAEVGVGSGQTDEEPAYLAGGTVRPRFVELGGNDLTVEVRDRFNTAESGVNVTFSLEEGDGHFLDSQGQVVNDDLTVTTDENGRAEVAFKPTTNDSVTIEATADLGYPGSTPDANETVVFEDIAVISGGGGGGGDDDSEFNPADADSFTLTDATIKDIGTGNNQETVVDAKFENRGDDASIAATRINAYITNRQDQGKRNLPSYASINGTNHTIAGPYVTSHSPGFQQDISGGEHITYRFEFEDSSGASYEPNEGDFFVYSIEFEDGSVARYFVYADDV